MKEPCSNLGRHLFIGPPEGRTVAPDPVQHIGKLAGDGDLALRSPTRLASRVPQALSCDQRPTCVRNTPAGLEQVVVQHNRCCISRFHLVRSISPDWERQGIEPR
jgi:hypothetical protein